VSLAPTGPSYSCASWQEFIIGADGYANAWRGAQASCSSVAMGPPTDDLQRINTVSRLSVRCLYCFRCWGKADLIVILQEAGMTWETFRSH
jgi:hypothetical protein